MTIRSRYYRADEFFEIHGTRGIIWVTRCTGEMLDLPPVMVIKGTETIELPGARWTGAWASTAPRATSSTACWRGASPPRTSHAATRMLQVPLAIYEAARTGRWVAPESVTVAGVGRRSPLVTPWDDND